MDNEYEPWALEHAETRRYGHCRPAARAFPAELGDKKLPDISPWLIEKWRTHAARPEQTEHDKPRHGRPAGGIG